MKRIDKIINDWDPINLLDAAPSDEYEGEILQICKIIKNSEKITVKELSKKIKKIFVTSFGEDVFVSSDEKLIYIAKEVLLQS